MNFPVDLHRRNINTYIDQVFVVPDSETKFFPLFEEGEHYSVCSRNGPSSKSTNVSKDKDI
jgi:hypothetical protein